MREAVLNMMNINSIIEVESLTVAQAYCHGVLLRMCGLGTDHLSLNLSSAVYYLALVKQLSVRDIPCFPHL